MAQEACARRAIVDVVTESHHYRGTLHVPDGKRRVSDVLEDGRAFLCLTDVATDSGAAQAFLAVNKTAIVTLSIVCEASSTTPAIVAPPNARTQLRGC
ncbi:MAG: hypothetical protein NDJ94_00870 [Vicinamibacteria bacterium]|nr:hypothetical protein [Vicinamibacteria bacterium]